MNKLRFPETTFNKRCPAFEKHIFLLSKYTYKFGESLIMLLI